MKFKILFLVGIVVILLSTISCKMNKMEKLQLKLAIPAEGNSWIENSPGQNSEVIGKGGIKNWSDENLKIRTWFKTVETGKLDIGLVSRTVSGTSSIKIICGDKSETILLKNPDWDTIPVGTFTILNPGYQFIEIQGVYKSGDFFPGIESFLIGGEATKGNVYFVKDDFYWGRRGPSVHLNFLVPDDAGEVEYFYNEITCS